MSGRTDATGVFAVASRIGAPNRGAGKLVVIYTVECPQGHKVLETFPAIETTTLVELSEPGTWRRLLERAGPDHQDAMDAFLRAMPKGANAVVGTRIATAVAVDGQGLIHLAITYFGTPVVLDPGPKKHTAP
jgi:uncharacterized protein YbjQ (UPF0145 family)